MRRDVPPVGVPADQLHRLLSSSAEHQRNSLLGPWLLDHPVDVCLAPVLADQPEGAVQPRDASGRVVAVGQPEPVELLRPGTPAETELEAVARGGGERDGLLGQHGRLPERVAQHEVSDSQPLGVGGDPGRDGHRLPDALVRGTRRLEVVDERDAVETSGLGRARTLDDVGNPQPHLGQEQEPFGHRCVTLAASAPLLLLNR